MSDFERRALAELEASGVKPESVAADSLRLEPFGSAFLLRWDGAVVLSADEVMELLGATPHEVVHDDSPRIQSASTQSENELDTTRCWWPDVDGRGEWARHDYYDGVCVNCHDHLIGTEA